MARRRLGYLAVLTGCLVFFGFYRGWFAWITLLAAAALPLFSLAISLPAMLTVKLYVQGPAAVEAEAQARVRLAWRCPLPPPPVRGKLRVSGTLHPLRRKLPSQAALPTGHCDGLVISPRRVRVYDYLGLFALPRRGQSLRTAVFPREIAPAAPLPTPPENGAGPGAPTSQSYELRLYRPGDDLRLLHRKLSAKLGKPVVREPQEPVRPSVGVVLVLSGDPDALDRKLSRLLRTGQGLLEAGQPFSLRAQTGDGVLSREIAAPSDLERCLRDLLFSPPAQRDTLPALPPGRKAIVIGGGPDEA